MVRSAWDLPAKFHAASRGSFARDMSTEETSKVEKNPEGLVQSDPILPFGRWTGIFFTNL